MAETARVEPSVFIGEDVLIYGHAQIRGRVRATGRARVSGDWLPGNLSTLIEDEVSLCGFVRIEGCVLLRDRCQVRDHAVVSGMVQAMHRVMIMGHAQVDGDVQLLDGVFLYDRVKVRGGDEPIVISGDRALGGDGVYDDPKAFAPRRMMGRSRRRSAPGVGGGAVGAGLGLVATA